MPPPPTPIVSVDPEAKRIFDEAQAKLRAKEYDNAAALFGTASKLRPNWSEPLLERAKINAKLGRFTETIEDCTQALRLDPSDPVALNFRGFARLSLYQLKDAISDFDEAIRLKPDYHDAYENRGNAKWALQDKQGAKADYDNAHSLQNPNTKR
jgi:tetratricopeptide (TPR) repeat protein